MLRDAQERTFEVSPDGQAREVRHPRRPPDPPRLPPEPESAANSQPSINWLGAKVGAGVGLLLVILAILFIVFVFRGPNSSSGDSQQGHGQAPAPAERRPPLNDVQQTRGLEFKIARLGKNTVELPPEGHWFPIGKTIRDRPVNILVGATWCGHSHVALEKLRRAKRISGVLQHHEFPTQPESIPLHAVVVLENELAEKGPDDVANGKLTEVELETELRSGRFLDQPHGFLQYGLPIYVAREKELRKAIRPGQERTGFPTVYSCSEDGCRENLELRAQIDKLPSTFAALNELPQPGSTADHDTEVRRAFLEALLEAAPDLPALLDELLEAVPSGNRTGAADSDKIILTVVDTKRKYTFEGHVIELIFAHYSDLEQLRTELDDNRLERLEQEPKPAQAEEGAPGVVLVLSGRAEILVKNPDRTQSSVKVFERPAQAELTHLFATTSTGADLAQQVVHQGRDRRLEWVVRSGQAGPAPPRNEPLRLGIVSVGQLEIEISGGETLTLLTTDSARGTGRLVERAAEILRSVQLQSEPGSNPPEIMGCR
jgi:hypothetical protein